MMIWIPVFLKLSATLKKYENECGLYYAIKPVYGIINRKTKKRGDSYDGV